MGAVGLNTIATFGLLLILMVVSAIVFGEDLPAFRLALGASVVIAIFAIVFHPISKTLWSAIDLMMVKLEPGEVDPRFDPTDYDDAAS